MPGLNPLFHIAAGVALILFGVRFLRKGLVRGMGDDLDTRLAGIMRGRWGTSLAGFIFGVFAPSSTTQSILTVNLLKGGKLSPSYILAFLLWANAGITVTVQLISLKLTAYYPLLLVVGVIAFQFFRAEKIRALGQCLFSFGLIFMAMSIMGPNASKLASEGDLSEIIKIAARHPWGMLFVAAAAAVGLQSSMAVLGIAFALFPSGVIPPEGLLSIVVGTSVGIGVTTLIASFSDPQAKLMATTGLIVKTLVALTAMPLIPWYVSTTQAFGVYPILAAAWFHAIISVTTALLGTMASPILATRLAKITASSADQNRTQFSLDYGMLSEPRMALACASREAVKLGELVCQMFQEAWKDESPRDHGSKVKKNLRKSLQLAAQMEEDINSYVGSLPWGKISKSEKELAFGIMNFASQLEGTAVAIEQTLSPLINRMATSGALTPEEEEDLGHVRSMVAHRLDASTAILSSRDSSLATSFLRAGQEVKLFTINVLKKKYRDLTPGQNYEKTAKYIDLVRTLRRISGQINTIGHTFAPTGLRHAEETAASDQSSP